MLETIARWLWQQACCWVTMVGLHLSCSWRAAGWLACLVRSCFQWSVQRPDEATPSPTRRVQWIITTTTHMPRVTVSAWRHRDVIVTPMHLQRRLSLLPSNLAPAKVVLSYTYKNWAIYKMTQCEDSVLHIAAMQMAYLLKSRFLYFYPTCRWRWRGCNVLMWTQGTAGVVNSLCLNVSIRFHSKCGEHRRMNRQNYSYRR